MALSAILDTIDGLNDEVKGHYTEIKDGPNAGKFRLDAAAGVEHVSDVTSDDQLHAVALEWQAVRRAAQVSAETVALQVQTCPFRMT